MSSSVTRKRRFAVGPDQTISREQCPGLDLTTVRRQHLHEFHLTFRPLPGERINAMLARLGATLRKNQATPVKQDFFGALSAHKSTLRALKQQFGKIDWPVTWVEGADCADGKIAGTHLLAIRGAKVEPICLGRRRVGSIYDDGSARHCFLGDLSSSDFSQPPAVQTRQAYANMETALQAAGMQFTDVVRTWFFLDNILGWYGAFNQVRSEFLRRKGVFNNLVPASTGVGARNPAGAALVAGAWAVQPVNGTVVASEVNSPLQCPAPTYGSSFSRAVELSTPEHRHLLISGTASIEPGGRSLHAGDVAKQIDLTMKVVQGILASRGMSFLDVSRVTTYFKHTKDAPAFVDWCAKNSAAFFPAVTTRSDICRDELLFEVEMDAMMASPPNP